MKPTDKVKFTGVRTFWFNDVIENGNKLEKGKTYTIKTLKEWSSWTEVTLEETGNLKYNSVWFEEL